MLGSTRALPDTAAMRPSALAGVLSLGACATPPPAPRVPLPAADQPVVVELPPGTLLQLLPPERVGPATEGLAAEASAADEAALLAGLWREAMRASPRFDVAAGLEDVPAPTRLQVHVDPASATATSTLVVDGRPPTALAAVPAVRGDAAATLQALADATRAALGDRAPADAPPLRLAYSSERACVLATEAALRAAASGDLPAARGRLDEARRADAGCTVTLLASAELHLRTGDGLRARRVAEEGLRLENRCSASTAHRLARTLLLARAALANPVDAAQIDVQLLALGDAALARRPHDPHGAWTRAQALSLLGRFTEAETILAELRPRWPDVKQLPYHHALALLGSNRPEEALAALAGVQDALPPMQTAIPHAIALWAAGRHEELSRLLADLAARPDVQSTALLHHVRRMQAAHAILREDEMEAKNLLLTDLEWLRQRAFQLGQYADHLAATAHVLVLLGHAAEVARVVEAFERLPQLDEAARRALLFAGGLAAAGTRPAVADAAEASLGKEGESAWSQQIRAAQFRSRGELEEELTSLVRAARLDRSPLVRASLARALRTAGETAQATELLAALRDDLLRLELRHFAGHPLVDPAHALALLATR